MPGFRALRRSGSPPPPERDGDLATTEGSMADVTSSALRRWSRSGAGASSCARFSRGKLVRDEHLEPPAVAAPRNATGVATGSDRTIDRIYKCVWLIRFRPELDPAEVRERWRRAMARSRWRCRGSGATSRTTGSVRPTGSGAAGTAASMSGSTTARRSMRRWRVRSGRRCRGRRPPLRPQRHAAVRGRRGRGVRDALGRASGPAALQGRRAVAAGAARPRPSAGGGPASA